MIFIKFQQKYLKRNILTKIRLLILLELKYICVFVQNQAAENLHSVKRFFCISASKNQCELQLIEDMLLTKNNVISLHSTIWLCAIYHTIHI